MENKSTYSKVIDHLQRGTPPSMEFLEEIMDELRNLRGALARIGVQEWKIAGAAPSAKALQQVAMRALGGKRPMKVYRRSNDHIDNVYRDLVEQPKPFE